jgi:NAD-dependent deacetylase
LKIHNYEKQKGMEDLIQQAAEIIKKSKFTMAFTGAGISVESGIPPFRGEHGLWNKYDPKVLELGYFLSNGETCWQYIREIFYDFFGNAQPNSAHKILTHMEKMGLLHAIVTQNIDNLHQMAGSGIVYEFHGNSNRLLCLRCHSIFPVKNVDLNLIPPRCPHDNSILKPDFIFFGEGIPPVAYEQSFEAANKCEVCLIIGSTGEVAPASYVPHAAKRNGALIIEINPEASLFTQSITDIHLAGGAGEILSRLENHLLE